MATQLLARPLPIRVKVFFMPAFLTTAPYTAAVKGLFHSGTEKNKKREDERNGVL
ncbi:hypothetical protein [Desulfitobacterium hafniense]|uniref:hypothetical protein n=1 Tax=Desulfitobacterium hafniense TaxID=49338 RepID=UPI001AEBEE9D|nr:hypothetical protein [Desulfitobacterium hafniense]